MDTRPANCRERLKDHGKAYGKSNCAICGSVIRANWKCPHAQLAKVNEPINKIEQDDIDFFVEMRDADDFKNGVNVLDLYQKIATKCAFYPGKGSSLGLMYAALKLNGEAGELAEHVGKALRDDNYVLSGITNDGEHLADLGGSLTRERREALILEIGDNLWYLAAICNELGIKLSEAAVGNLEKLFDRGKRNVLQGSGDKR